jgi:hypothetical protein
MTEFEQNIDYSSLSYEELTKISRDDHQEDVRQYDKQQNALCLVVIGGIILICGIIFFILSFARRNNKVAIEFSSLPFFIFIACMIGSLTLLTIGITRFMKAHKIRKVLKQEIITVTNLKTEMIKQKEVGGF